MRLIFAAMTTAIAFAACGSPKPAPPDATTARASASDAAPPPSSSDASAAATAPTDAVVSAPADTTAPSPADAAPSPIDAASAPDVSAAPTRGPLTPLSTSTGALEDRLLAEVGTGRPVAILAWYDGLVAMSADGARIRLLVPGPTEWALVDDRARVIWFGKVGEPRKVEGEEVDTVDIWVLDLTAEGTAPRLIARGLQTGLEVFVSHPPHARGKRADEVGFGRGYSPSIRIQMDEKRPRFEAEGGIYADIGIADTAEHLKAVRRAQPDATTRAFLLTLVARGKDRTATLPAPDQPAPPDRLPVPVDDCEEEDICGAVSAFTGTPYWRVIVEHSCGDACFPVENLYDPRTRKWIDPNDPAVTSDTPIGDAAAVAQAFIARDGSAFIMDGAVFPFGKPPIIPQSPEDRASISRGGGWLGGQWFVD